MLFWGKLLLIVSSVKLFALLGTGKVAPCVVGTLLLAPFNDEVEAGCFLAGMLAGKKRDSSSSEKEGMSSLSSSGAPLAPNILAIS